MTKKILILGGYGNFGGLICDFLVKRTDIELIIVGRDKNKANRFCESLKANGATCQLSTVVIDVHSIHLLQALQEIHPYMVIHTCGPFQGQDYHVPRACIMSGSHYIDLADDRRFVCDFYTLDELAKQNEVIAISGASSVPGMSSVVIDHYAKEFATMDTIDFCIAPGSNVEIGEATLKGILSYMGQPFQCWEHGKWINRYGWMDSEQVNLGLTLGTRWLANVDIPDLELFPDRYPGIQTVRFRAGHELGLVHLSMDLMAKLSRLGWFGRWDKLSGILFKAGQCIKTFGSDCGGMVIRLSGINHQQQQTRLTWRLIAKNAVGPRIPTISSIILANQILNGVNLEPGARPCLGMYTLDEFNQVADTWGIYQEKEQTIG